MGLSSCVIDYINMMSIKLLPAVFLIATLAVTSAENDGLSPEAQLLQEQVQPLSLWQECDYSSLAGSTCVNCNTRLICTKVGGFLKPCSVLRPYCINGICLSTPSDACAESETEEPETPEETTAATPLEPEE